MEENVPGTSSWLRFSCQNNEDAPIFHGTIIALCLWIDNQKECW